MNDLNINKFWPFKKAMIAALCNFEKWGKKAGPFLTLPIF
jgi:hypothetical protein